MCANLRKFRAISKVVLPLPALIISSGLVAARTTRYAFKLLLAAVLVEDLHVGKALARLPSFRTRSYTLDTYRCRIRISAFVVEAQIERCREWSLAERLPGVRVVLVLFAHEPLGHGAFQNGQVSIVPSYASKDPGRLQEAYYSAVHCQYR